MRNLDSGEEAIGNQGIREQLRHLATTIHVRALATATALTAISWIAK
ncbi:MAG TPA: hypothetical protein VGA09_11775 [Candidatus Binatia bacterium]